MSKQKDNLEIIELTEENIESMVYFIRGQKVMLDFDLARIYGYETKRFNEQVKNNIDKFPKDFMFQLSNAEYYEILRSKKTATKGLNPNTLKSQFVTSSETEILKSKKSASKGLNADTLRSQFVTSNELSSKRRYNPYAFTEQGI